jgi:hypothetical protein
VYFGFSAGLQLLDVASFSLALRRNDFARCSVILSINAVSSNNVYGGGVSVYMGGYSSFVGYSSFSFGVAAVGDTAVRNASIHVEMASFTSCSAATGTFAGNSYGGSFSLYLGGYAWSNTGNIASGLTTASGVNVSISNVNSSDCSATTTSSHGCNSYGGSMSVVYIGAYAWTFTYSNPSGAYSSCGITNVTGLVVSISSSTFTDSSATSSTFHSAPFQFPELTHIHLQKLREVFHTAPTSVLLRFAHPPSYCHCACVAL